MSTAAEEGPAYVDPDPLESALIAALNLAKNLGWPVFPLNIGKKPTTPNGFKDASTDPARIATMWRLRPGPLVGVATGEVSGVDLLDIDVEHPQAVAWYAAASKRIPPTRTYGTRRGGHHLHFQHAKDVRNSTSKLASGVDVRGDGGYLVHWFSAGTACEDHAPPAPWPPWLLGCVLWKPPLEPAAPAITAHADGGINGIVKFVADGAEGQRNNRLHWSSCRMLERINAGQVNRADAKSRLLAAAANCGLTKVEAARTISSAWGAA